VDLRLSVRWTARGSARPDLQRLRAGTIAGLAGSLYERTELPSGEPQILSAHALLAAPHGLTATAA
jgi:hypothetical protein